MNRIAQNLSGDYRFKFTFVMPVYNAERYLAETVESILSQTMDFAKNCQIIFINDGSTDDSESACLDYKAKYPDNIVYLKQINKGVSAARNVGIAKADGKYISFLDSDDKISNDTLDNVYYFFEKHNNKIDVVSIKIVNFEARVDQNVLNNKFTTSCIIDIRKNHELTQVSAASSFFTQEILSKGFRFDEEISIGEDLKFMTLLLMNKQKYGVLSQPTYFYRRRNSLDSATDKSKSIKSWYLDIPHKVYFDLIKESQKKYDKVTQYIQYAIMSDMKWRFWQQDQDVLTDKELGSYKSSLYKTLSYIDDDIILSQKNTFIDDKLFVLGKKHNQSVYSNAEARGSKIYYKDNFAYDYKKSKNIVYIDSLQRDGDTAIIEGTISGLIFDCVNILFVSNQSTYNPTWIDLGDKKKMFLGETVFTKNAFSLHIPIKESSILSYIIISGIKRSIPIEIMNAKKINDGSSQIYSGDLIGIEQRGVLIIRKRNFINFLKRQYRQNVKPLLRRVK